MYNSLKSLKRNDVNNNLCLMYDRIESLSIRTEWGIFYAFFESVN